MTSQAIAAARMLLQLRLPGAIDPGATALGASRRRSAYERQKRCLDVVVCLLALPVLVPLGVVCAVAVRCSGPGPILFAQQRTGLGGRPFTMYKFRSMVADAAQRKEQLKQQVGISGPDFKLAGDPRITRTGRVMRALSLDELPQFWNVLCGDMTLVGPRPTSFLTGAYVLWHTERLDVRPGLTGLWQIHKRGDTDFDARVRLDIRYVRERSLMLDLKILALTIPAVASRKGAY